MNGKPPLAATIASARDSGAQTPSEGQRPSESEDREDWWSFAKFVLKVVLAVLVFRTFLFAPFTIPSESMLPGLWKGDYLVAAKWPYGYSDVSMPFQAPLVPGRILADLPERGDVVIFKHPIDGTDYIKRAIGLPGDTVALRGGRVVLNGELLEQEVVREFDLPLSANTQCVRGGLEMQTAAGMVCRYRMARETLPSGRSYHVLDFGLTPQDDFGPVVVPRDRLFVMGDNRDNSQDSRFDAAPGGGVGLVPTDRLVGRASMVLWSTDGGAEWIKPWTWFTAARWDRIGEGL
ncbi:signal peptidase I [Qipengyuania sp. DY56-A-20]|jgi:signal peptidase I|uniref:Signal peptidase I n=1 Tax=Qipengyuania benthica TaxID=3067651 RepID=A0ABT9H8W2_9SPHN|nr:signal peptidase I [Qipengyuania sp. DY56-A-20]MDP4539760.1 signal peptidase I [Qipengyuania sp. DY56-A-20]